MCRRATFGSSPFLGEPTPMNINCVRKKASQSMQAPFWICKKWGLYALIMATIFADKPNKRDSVFATRKANFCIRDLYPHTFVLYFAKGRGRFAGLRYPAIRKTSCASMMRLLKHFPKIPRCTDGFAKPRPKYRLSACPHACAGSGTGTEQSLALL